MSTKKWRLVKDEENLAYYSSCNDIHVKAGSLIIQLRKIIFELKNLQKRKEQTLYEKTEHKDVDIQVKLFLITLYTLYYLYYNL